MISLPNRKALPGLLALVALTLCIAACKNFFVDPKLTSITVNDLNIVVGTTKQATATGTYDDGSTKTPPPNLNWASDDPSVATVDAKGVVSGLDAGTGSKTANITATAGAISGSGKVTVSLGTITSIAISPSSQTITHGQTFNFKANATYSGGGTSDVTNLATWTSDNTAAFTVLSTGSATPGQVTAVAAGTGNLTASLGGKSGTAAITIN